METWISMATASMSNGLHKPVHFNFKHLNSVKLFNKFDTLIVKAFYARGNYLYLPIGNNIYAHRYKGLSATVA